MFKEPFIPINRVPVSVYNIDKGIELKQRDHIVVLQHTDIPQNRRCPHADLQPDIDDLGKIPEKHHDSAGRIGQSQHKNIGTETVIYDLYRINRRITPVTRRHDQKNQYKKQMDKSRRNDLDDRKDADLKYHLFYQIIIFQKRCRPVVQRLGKIKPGAQPPPEREHRAYWYRWIKTAPWSP